MTDASFPLSTINGFDSVPPALPPTFPAASQHPRFPPPRVDDVHEDDDGVINCICGFPEDDGSTVQCDECNRWQHISCYYPKLDGPLSEDVQHFCIVCRPRDINVDLAKRLQVQNLQHERTDGLSNGVKRVAPKPSHKKKVKEAGVANTNGWPLDKSRHDRNSASPRDLGPPSKRPKTSHRPSDSTTTVKGHSRKRNASNVNHNHHHRRSLSRSPDAATDKYSEEFLRRYEDDEWTLAHTNLHSSIAIREELSRWLAMPDSEFEHEHGFAKQACLMRYEGDLDGIDSRADIEIRVEQDTTVLYRDHPPTWKTVTIRDPIAEQALIGELKGFVGFKRDYCTDEELNRWSQLRHPEPFVFFHSMIPIYIDSRKEGTELRYVRRSCQPNARLQIIVTHGVEYHFCFMATRDINPGEEISVGWEVADGLPHLTGKTGMSQHQIATLSDWVSAVLANCGPCACHLPESECRMSRFDRRNQERKDEAQSARLPNGKAKRRKAGPSHTSPLNTHALNSRSGSEARKVDPADDDDGATDSRSVSGSAGRDSASRDITPNTHYSANGVSASTEMSERERKKLAKEEEMFRRQEEEQTGKQAKKKRHSGGSNVTTPNPASANRAGFFSNMTTTTSRSADASSTGKISKSSAGRKVKTSRSSAKSAGQQQGLRRPKPEYVDACTQGDLGEEEAAARQSTNLAAASRPFVSTRERLLELCARNNAIVVADRRRQHATSPLTLHAPRRSKSHSPHPTIHDHEAPRSPELVETPSEKQPSSVQQVKVEAPEPQPEGEGDGDVDVEMSDALPVLAPVPGPTPDLALQTLITEPLSAINPTPPPPLDPPAPPWSPAPASLPPPPPPSSDDHSPHPSNPPPHVPASAPAPTESTRRPADLHVQMPPPPPTMHALNLPALPSASSSPSTATAAAATTVAPLSAGTATLAQSPLGFPSPVAPSTPLFSPSAAVSASSAAAAAGKKKLSLSDYTRRSKANRESEPGLNKSERDRDRESSPASVASGPVAGGGSGAGAGAAAAATIANVPPPLPSGPGPGSGSGSGVAALTSHSSTSTSSSPSITVAETNPADPDVRMRDVRDPASTSTSTTAAAATATTATVSRA